MVASQIGQPANWVVIDVVRVADGMLAEHWDVIEDEATRSQSQSGLPMFGETFPAEAATPDDGLAAFRHRHPTPRIPADERVRQLPASPAQSRAGRYRKHPRVQHRDRLHWKVRRAETTTSAACAQSPSSPTSAGPTAPSSTSTAAATSADHRPSGTSLAAGVALAANATVHAVDYRLAPDPASRRPTMIAWRPTPGLSATAGSILDHCRAGRSAGGNLAVAVTVAARDLRTSATRTRLDHLAIADLTFSGPSMEERRERDPYVTRALLESMATDYVGESDPADPRCSAVFADLSGLPPLLIQVGENEILYDDAVRIRDAGAGRRGGCHVRVVATRNARLAGLHRRGPAGVRPGDRTRGSVLQSSHTRAVNRLGWIAVRYETTRPQLIQSDSSAWRGPCLNPSARTRSAIADRSGLAHGGDGTPVRGHDGHRRPAATGVVHARPAPWVAACGTRHDRVDRRGKVAETGDLITWSLRMRRLIRRGLRRRSRGLLVAHEHDFALPAGVALGEAYDVFQSSRRTVRSTRALSVPSATSANRSR